jgi:NAD(P)-dependent dehydrogenase (short-subunit alcohol dehydrogenase family)
LASLGCKIASKARSLGLLKDLSKELNDKGVENIFQADTLSEKDCNEVMDVIDSKWGRVITILSRLGKEGGGRPWFNMAKASQVAMMKTLSLTNYLVRDGITFNTIVLGGIYIEGTGFEKKER